MCVPRPPAPPSSLLPLSNLLSKEVLGAKRYIIFHLSGGRVLLFCLATTVWATTTIMLVEDLKLIPFFHCLHCPKRYSDIRIKTKPWSLSWSGCNCMQYCLAYAVNRAEKPDIRGVFGRKPDDSIYRRAVHSRKMSRRQELYFCIR